MFMLISAALLAIGAIQAPPFPTATVTLAAPIFVAPGDKVPLRVAAKGTFLHVLKEDADWVEVEFQDPQYGRRVGWMEARFLSISRPALQPMDLSVAKAAAAARPSAEPGAIAVTGATKMVSFWSGMVIGTETIRFDCQSPFGNAEPWLA